MKLFKNYKNAYNFVISSIFILPAFLLIQSCKTDKKQSETKIEKEKIEKEKVVEILTENMDFQMPDTISSGWNTFRYKNSSPQTHFFLIDKYPEGKTSEDAENFIAPVFDNAMKLIMEGKTEEGYAEFSKLPEWFNDVVFVGGSGLLSPNQVSITSLNLKQGKYIIECYVKMKNGVFHTSMGMTKDLVVTNNDSGYKEPKADISINISSTDGIVINDTISSGKHTFSVYFKDQIVHENFVGHDIHLVKLEENADIDKLEHWMNWANPEGLIEPAPPHITFLGGVNDMPAGSIGYFTATLEKGKYALISEVPNALSKNMLQTFVISE